MCRLVQNNWVFRNSEYSKLLFAGSTGNVSEETLSSTGLYSRTVSSPPRQIWRRIWPILGPDVQIHNLVAEVGDIGGYLGRHLLEGHTACAVGLGEDI